MMDRTNSGKSLSVLIMGSLLSVIVSLLLANQFSSPYQYVIGLLSEIIVLIISLSIFVYEINTRVLDSIQDQDILLSAHRVVLSQNDTNFKDQYNLIKLQLKELSKGHYELDNLPSVYSDDIDAIKSLKEGEKLYSMCPVGGELKDVSAQFTNKSFCSSMAEHYRATNRGVIVQRVYIFEKNDSFAQSPECKAHLNEAIDNEVDVRLIFLDDLRFEDAKYLPHDFIIFANNKVSVGKVGLHSWVDGADVWSGEDEINYYRQKYDQLLRQSENYTQKLKG